MSISKSRVNSRMTSKGTRLSPPAMSFAASPCCDNSPQASSIEAVRAYSKGGDFNGQPQRHCPIGYSQARLTATLLGRKIACRHGWATPWAEYAQQLESYGRWHVIMEMKCW